MHPVCTSHVMMGSGRIVHCFTQELEIKNQLDENYQDNFIFKKLHGAGAEETTQFQGTIALVEDWGSVPSIHLVGHNHS